PQSRHRGAARPAPTRDDLHAARPWWARSRARARRPRKRTTPEIAVDPGRSPLLHRKRSFFGQVVAFPVGGEAAGLDILAVGLSGHADGGGQVGIGADEFRARAETQA